MFEVLENIDGKIVKKTVYGVRSDGRHGPDSTEFLFFEYGEWVWFPSRNCSPYIEKEMS